MIAFASLTVVIPVYNRSHCIGRAVRSVLDQDFPVQEILLVDDGSTDDLASAADIDDERVRIVRHPSNLGAAAARNTGILAAKGEYIAFLDSDDAWKPGKLTRQMEFMARCSQDISCTGFETMAADDYGAPVVAWRPYREIIGVEDVIWGCYLSPGSTLVAKRALLLDLQGYDVSFERYEDWDLLLRIVDGGTKGIGFLNIPLATIYLGGHLNPKQAFAGLRQMHNRHFKRLHHFDRHAARQFRSALAFNRASIHAFTGNWSAMALNLLKSLLLSPCKHWPLAVLVLPRLRNVVCRGKR